MKQIIQARKVINYALFRQLTYTVVNMRQNIVYVIKGTISRRRNARVKIKEKSKSNKEHKHRHHTKITRNKEQEREK